MDYNRAEKHKLDAEKIKKSTTRHLSSLQKVLAFIGTCLGLITASITIYTFTHPSAKSQPAPKVIKEKVIEKSTTISNQSGPSHAKTNDNVPDTKTSSSTVVDNGTKYSSANTGSTTHSSTQSNDTVPSSSVTETVPSSETATSNESNNISSNTTTNTVPSGNTSE
jgi:putative membrane protein